MSKLSIPSIFVLLQFFGNTFLLAQTASETSPFTIGDRIKLYSEELQEERILNVYLPHGYSPDSAATYPVIYLLDGSIHEDFIHVAGLVQFCSYPWIAHLPPSIVVGIENVDRQRDFTYHTDREDYLEQVPTLGGSAAFISFLREEVKLFI